MFRTFGGPGTWRRQRRDWRILGGGVYWGRGRGECREDKLESRGGQTECLVVWDLHVVFWIRERDEATVVINAGSVCA